MKTGEKKLNVIMLFFLSGLLVFLAGNLSLHGQDDPEKEKNKKAGQQQKQETKDTKTKAKSDSGKSDSGKSDSGSSEGGRVVTNKDIRSKPPAKTKQTDKSGQTGKKNTVSPTKTSTGGTVTANQKRKPNIFENTSQDPKKTREYWQGLKSGLEKRIKDIRDNIAQMEDKIGKLQFEYRQTSMAQRQIDIQQESGKLRRQVENYKRGLTALQKELDELPDKARKAGVPRGWVR